MLLRFSAEHPKARSLLRPIYIHLADLVRTNEELRAVLVLAGKRIVKLNFGRRDDKVLPILRRVLREARQR